MVLAMEKKKYPRNWYGIEVKTWDEFKDDSLPSQKRVYRRLNQMKLDKLKEVSDSAGIGMSDIPEEFTATLTDVKQEADKFDTDCIFVSMDVEGIGETQVKYTPLHTKRLLEKLEELKILQLNLFRIWIY